MLLYCGYLGDIWATKSLCRKLCDRNNCFVNAQCTDVSVRRGNRLTYSFVIEQKQEGQQMIHYNIHSQTLPRRVQPMPQLSEWCICALALCIDRQSDPSQANVKIRWDTNCHNIFTALD